MKREDFYISNCCKCYPKISRTPNVDCIEKCHHWILEEIEIIKPCLILIFGNTGLKSFGHKHPMITKLNATIEWNEKLNTWICWCMHPSSVLHNLNNKSLFEEGIYNFNKKIISLGGFK